MDGPQHYREAERIITELTYIQGGEEHELGFPEAMALAQVHATLAVAAASVPARPAASADWTAVLGG